MILMRLMIKSLIPQHAFEIASSHVYYLIVKELISVQNEPSHRASFVY